MGARVPSVADRCERDIGEGWTMNNAKRDRLQNARLIAAAPDLLTACEVALAEFRNAREALDEPWWEFDPAIKCLEAAIQKAKNPAETGEETNMKCNQKECEKEASVSYVWPTDGKRKLSCEEHAQTAAKILAVLGFGVVLERVQAKPPAETGEVNNA
jgi:hypothetical protein